MYEERSQLGLTSHSYAAFMHAYGGAKQVLTRVPVGSDRPGVAVRPQALRGIKMPPGHTDSQIPNYVTNKINTFMVRGEGGVEEWLTHTTTLLC